MFRKEFPKLYELRDIINIEIPESPCLKNLDENFQCEAMRMAFRSREDALQTLDSIAWGFITKKASKAKWDAVSGRGQQQLIDLLNEALAYK